MDSFERQAESNTEADCRETPQNNQPKQNIFILLIFKLLRHLGLLHFLPSGCQSEQQKLQYYCIGKKRNTKINYKKKVGTWIIFN